MDLEALFERLSRLMGPAALRLVSVNRLREQNTTVGGVLICDVARGLSGAAPSETQATSQPGESDRVSRSAITTAPAA